MDLKAVVWHISTGTWIVASVHRVAKCSIDEGKDQADTEQEEQDNPTHPRKSDQRRQEAAFQILAAPMEVPPECLQPSGEQFL